MAFAAPQRRQAGDAPGSREGGASRRHSRDSLLSSERRPPPRFLHDGKVMQYEGSVFDKLMDPSLYTGTHKHRFDVFGRGKGLEGRRDAYELLDSGVLFENTRSNHARSGSSTGDASDRAESLWMKSLRAAVHSPSLAKQLAASSAGGGTVRYPKASRTCAEANSRTGDGDVEEDPAAYRRPLIQAWILDEDGRLVYDDQRTRHLVEEDVRDVNLITTGRASPQRHSRGDTFSDPPPATSFAVDDDRSSGQVRPLRGNEPSRNVRLQRSAPDLHKQSSVTTHMRRLLYEDKEELGVEWGEDNGDTDRDRREVHPKQEGGAYYLVHAPDGEEDDDAPPTPTYAPQEQFRRWHARTDATSPAGPSLEETLAMLSEYDASR